LNHSQSLETAIYFIVIRRNCIPHSLSGEVTFILVLLDDVYLFDLIDGMSQIKVHHFLLAWTSQVQWTSSSSVVNELVV